MFADAGAYPILYQGTVQYECDDGHYANDPIHQNFQYFSGSGHNYENLRLDDPYTNFMISIPCVWDEVLQDVRLVRPCNIFVQNKTMA